MIQSKLFVLNLEIKLLWTEMVYERKTKLNGKPYSEVEGGLITVCFETTPDIDFIMRWMTKASEGGDLLERDKMEEGMICFYSNGFDNPPSKTYKFNDAFLVDYTFTFSADDENAMQTVLTISPAIQDYGAQVIRGWNLSYVAPTETEPFQAQETETKDEPKFLGYHFENDKGEKIGKDKIKIDEVVYLFIKTEKAEGEKITINLDDDALDYKYNGKVLKNDVLKGVDVTGDVTKVKLTAVAQEK